MKKWIFLIIGGVFSITGLAQFCKLIVYIDELTEMGKGYIVGSLILFIIGVIFIIIGIRSKRKTE
jgi:hypothetical protein